MTEQRNSATEKFGLMPWLNCGNVGPQILPIQVGHNMMTARERNRSVGAIHMWRVTGTLMIRLVSAALLIGTASTQAQTYTVLHNFTYEGGNAPYGSLMQA